MTTTLRITRRLYEQIHRDLLRPHAYAFERVGFLKMRLGTAADGEKLLLAAGYESVADEHYIDDPESGARINGDAIRRAMEISLQEDVGVFHVHLHDFPGTPALGRMDQREIPRLVETFRVTNPSYPHGIFLLGSDSFSSWVWFPGVNEPVTPDKSVIVGMPLYYRPSTDA